LGGLEEIGGGMVKRTARLGLLLFLVFIVQSGMSAPRAIENSPAVTTDTLKQLVAAFNAHDLDAVMAFFADDCELYMPRGKEPSGTHYVGKAAVREGLATRFSGIPNVHYGDDHHWVAGNQGVSTWLLTGTNKAGEDIRVRGVDLLEFRDGKVVKKDSYWKIIEK
jgi:ketosteroid isomerase-like protein